LGGSFLGKPAAFSRKTNLRGTVIEASLSKLVCSFPIIVVQYQTVAPVETGDDTFNCRGRSVPPFAARPEELGSTQLKQAYVDDADRKYALMA